MVATACCAVRTPQRGVPTSPRERFSSTRGLTCVIRNLDVKQDYDLGGDGCRIGGCPNGVRCAIVHPGQRVESEGLSITLLSQRDVLYHVGKEYSSFDAGARQEWFGAGDKCHRRAGGRRCFAASIMGRIPGLPNWPRVNRIIVAATSCTLYIPHLIQGR